MIAIRFSTRDSILFLNLLGFKSRGCRRSHRRWMPAWRISFGRSRQSVWTRLFLHQNGNFGWRSRNILNTGTIIVPMPGLAAKWSNRIRRIWMPRSERFHFLVACFTVIDGNRWRREREEFMHPRYARVRIFALVRKNRDFMTVCQSDFFVWQVMSRGRKFESLFYHFRDVQTLFWGRMKFQFLTENFSRSWICSSFWDSKNSPVWGGENFSGK